MEGSHDLGLRFVYSSITDKESDKAKNVADALGKDLSFSDVSDLMSEFPVFWNWYTLIADAHHHIIPASPEVAEAYWIGNSLLEGDFDYSAVHEFVLKHFPDRYTTKRGIPAQPSGKPPHHNLYVDTYGLVMKPDASEEEVDACKVSYSHLSDIAVLDRSLLDDMNSFALPLSNNDVVAVHKNTICATLDGSQSRNLSRYGYDLQR